MSIFGINHPHHDALLEAKMSVPGTGKTEYSSAIDLTQQGGVDEARLVIEMDVMPSLAATKTVTATLQHSADGGASWVDVPTFSAKAVGGASGGSAEVSVESRIPVDIGALVRLKVVVDASAGDNTAASILLAVTV